MVQSYITYSIVLLSIYLLVLLKDKRFRLLLPSNIHTFTWLITSIFMYLELEGIMGDNIVPKQYNRVAEYIFYMMISSILGFSFAHIFKRPPITKAINNKIPLETVDAILKKFRWLLFACLIIGILQVTYIVSIGGFESLEDYRIIAVTAERTGYGAVAQQLSGHLAILGSLYLSLLGYKHSITSININEFIIAAISIATLNMAIAGRLWIIIVTLPYIIGYFYSMYIHKSTSTITKWKKDKKKMIIIGCTLIIIFSITGLVRNTETAEGDNRVKNFFNKFLYYTDGPKMANMVLLQYPSGTYQLEYGVSEFLTRWVPSPMSQKFNKSIEHDRGLSVTVKSSIPFLYYDWGYWGGIIMWGIYSFILEIICISLLYRHSIITLFIFMILTNLFFDSPIFSIFTYGMPRFLWLIIIFILRKQIFKGIPNIKQYL